MKPYWAARYITWLLIKLTPKGVAFSVLMKPEQNGLQLQVELRGGRAQQQLTAATTHIMLLEPGFRPPHPDPRDLLAAVSEQLGGVTALRHLKKGLSSGRVKLVQQR